MNLETQLRIARNLKTLRKTAKISQYALASSISISRSTYCQYEQGERLPDVNTLYSLAEFYRVRMDTIVNCDVQEVLSDYFINQDYSRQEKKMLAVFKSLSDFSKGRIVERAEELAAIDAEKRRDAFRIRY